MNQWLDIDDTCTYDWYQWDVKVDLRSRSQVQRSRSNMQFCIKMCFAYIPWTNDCKLMRHIHMISIVKMLKLTKGQGHKVKGKGQIYKFVKNLFGYIPWTNDLIWMILAHMIDINEMLKLTLGHGDENFRLLSVDFEKLMRQIFIFHFSLFWFVELEPEIVVCSIQNANVKLKVLVIWKGYRWRFCDSMLMVIKINGERNDLSFNT